MRHIGYYPGPGHSRASEQTPLREYILPVVRVSPHCPDLEFPSVSDLVSWNERCRMICDMWPLRACQGRVRQDLPG